MTVEMATIDVHKKIVMFKQADVIECNKYDGLQQIYSVFVQPTILEDYYDHEAKQTIRQAFYSFFGDI